MATITTLKSGDYTDTTVWSTGTVPVDGDKVTISKLGTATSRVTSSAISAGSGNVPVTSGTGTGLIGEVIEFDSRPGEYYELTTGFTASAGTAVVTPVLAGAIASGATLRNRGHKVKLICANRLTDATGYAIGATSVTLQAGALSVLTNNMIRFGSDATLYKVTAGVGVGSGAITVSPGLAVAIPASATAAIGVAVWGDDTSTGVNVNGVLYHDRASDTCLVHKGAFTQGSGAVHDLGTSVDPCVVRAEIRTNYSAAMSANKWGYAKNNAGILYAFGKVRARRTMLTVQFTAGASTTTVADATGWAVGDEILFVATASQGSPTNASQVLTIQTITPGSGTTASVAFTSTISVTKASGGHIANLTSNIRFKPYNASFPCSYSFGSTITAGVVAYDMDCRSNSTSTPFSIAGGSTRYPSNRIYIGRSSFWADGVNGSSAINAGKSVLIEDSVVLTKSNQGFCDSNSGGDMERVTLCATDNLTFYNTSSVATALGYFKSGVMAGYGSDRQLYLQGGVNVVDENVDIISASNTSSVGVFGGSFLTGSAQSVNLCPFGAGSARPLFSGSAGYSGDFTLFDSIYGAAPAWTYGSGGNDQRFLIVRCQQYSAPGVSITEGYRGTGYQTLDTSTRIRGDASLKLQNKVAGAAVFESFTSSIAAGQTRRIVGRVMRDTTYGSGAMPTITLSIPGQASVVSAAADVADTWQLVDLLITNSASTPQTLTVTLSANNAIAAGACWFDGIPIAPFVYVVRHYGFVFDESNPFRVVNTVTVASEATAAAYTGVTINSATPSITVGAGTTDMWQKLYDGHQYWGTQNLTQTVLLTSTDGQTFSLPLTCKLSWPSMPGDHTLAGGWLLLEATGVHSYRLSSTKIEFQMAGTYDMSGTVFSGTVEFINTSGGAVSVAVPSGTSYTNTGPSITVTAPVVTQSVTINGLISGSTVQIYDLTNAVELANGTSTTTFSWVDSVAAVASKDIRVRISYVSGVTAKEFIEAAVGTCGITSTDATVTYLASQVNDAVYIANAIDGSTVTGITISDGIDRMVISIAGGNVSWPQIYAYNVYWLSTTTGIQDDGAIMTAVDTANYLVTGFQIRNISSVALSITGGYGRDSVTGTVASLIDTSGSTGNIYQTPDHVVAYATGSGLSPAESAQLFAIPDADDVWANGKALTIGKFIALK